MKIIQLTLVLFLSFTLGGYAQKKPTKSANIALRILLAEYSETTSLTPVDTKKFIMYLSKKNHSTKGMKIKKVKQLTYLTHKKEKRTIYLIQRAEGISINGSSCHFNNDIFGVKFENQCDTSGEECDIITDSCPVSGDCTVYCVVSNSCDESGESNPNCCDGATCEEGDGIRPNPSDPLETLMG
ncbi:hypothetical protein [uncultured Dokdonia sp.]|uniref:hypothetical protein n=1 Tax=uncultured Dokdonia sp. TaxID=575653 RepID=UPI0026113C67|nr:hypothetical protein [uncultured Dokdonia sp.]